MNVLKYKKICCVTGSRAEYGIFKPLLKKLIDQKDLLIDLVATGSHLSDVYGNTIKEIKKDFLVNKEIRISNNQDTQISKIEEISLAQKKFGNYFLESRPDLVIIIGDRYEMLPVAISAYMLKVPIAHIHGGEVTEGSLDNGIRHAITMLSTIHFTSTEEYKNRVLSMGAKPENVLNVGALGIERVTKHKFSKTSSIEKELNFKLGKTNVIFTFHPPTNEFINFDELLSNFSNAVKAYNDLTVIFTGANADFGGIEINKKIKNFANANKNKYNFIESLGESLYLDVMNNSDFLFGNSSSAFLEASALGKPALNIGARQNGRIKPVNIIDCENNTDSIIHSIGRALSNNFLEKIKVAKNPYGDGNSSKKILNFLLNN